MTVIISSVKEIDDLHIDQLPAGKPLNVAKAVRIDRLTLFVTEDGRLYSDQLGKYAYCPGEWPWMNSLMRALHKMKVITKAQMDQHLALCECRSRARSKKHAAEYMQKLADEHGFELSDEQKSALEINA